MSKYTIFLESARWECSPNLIGCSQLYTYLSINGHTIIKQPEKADYIIINSCGVTDRGKNRSINIVKKYHQIKKENAKIILFGCLMDIDKTIADSLEVIPIGLHESKHLDTIFKYDISYQNIQPICNDELRTEMTKGKHSTAVKPTDNKLKNLFLENYPFILVYPLTKINKQIKQRYQQMMNRFKNNLYIEISKGCMGNCNYCLVKNAKGSLKSRSIQHILKDIESNYDSNKELFLVGDDCGCYGLDKGTTIIELLKTIYNKYPDMKLKINYIDPGFLIKYWPQFQDILQKNNITLVMIPLQSGSLSVLHKMNRSYDPEVVISAIKQFRIISPKTLLTSHFIIGHPGESWIDFFKTLSAARLFDYPAPFQYSVNQGTQSAQMPDSVSRLTAKFRLILFLFFLEFIILFRNIDINQQKQ